MTDERRFWITAKERTLWEETAGETGLDKLCALHPAGVKCERVERYSVRVKDEEGRPWALSPDRRLTFLRARPFYCHVDGPTHWTPAGRRKGHWEDVAITAIGERSFRVDSLLLEKPRYWPEVWDALVAFAFSGLDYTEPMVQ